MPATAAQDFTAFVELPVDLAAAVGDEPVTRRIQIAELGRFKDPRYGTFDITAGMVDNWRRLLDSVFQGERPIDFDHNTDKSGPTGSLAGAWIKSLALDGTKVMADVEFTPAGADAVRKREYRYISPTFVADYKDQGGRSMGPALLRAAFTNNPFLQSMPAIALSGATLAERIGDAADSRPAMPELTKIAEALGLAADADEATILDASAQLKAKVAETPKTLEVQAAEAGKVLLSKSDYEATKAKAGEATALEARVKKVETERADEKFETAFVACLDAGQVDAKAETKTEWRELYDVAPDATLKRLAALPKVVNLSTAGEKKVAVPEGGDGARFDLDAAAKAYELEHKVSYEEATIKVLEQQEVTA